MQENRIYFLQKISGRPVVQRLPISVWQGFVAGAATDQQDDLERTVRQTMRHGDTRRASAHNTKIKSS